MLVLMLDIASVQVPVHSMKKRHHRHDESHKDGQSFRKEGKGVPRRYKSRFDGPRYGQCYDERIDSLQALD